jgi:hypothetical protein
MIGCRTKEHYARAVPEVFISILNDPKSFENKYLRRLLDLSNSAGNPVVTYTFLQLACP